MHGVVFAYDEDLVNVLMTVNPAELERELNDKAVFSLVCETELKEAYISKSAVKAACDKANHLFKTNDKTLLVEHIGEKRNAEVAFKISEDEMEATLSLTAPYGGHTPSLDDLLVLAEKAGIKRGLGKKRIALLLDSLAKTEPGDAVSGLVAKGLPSRDGRSSFMKPLVPNALDRVLRPQADDKGKTDLRNLGDVICVKAKTPVVRRVAPTKGRFGYAVTGRQLDAKEGEWLPLKMGDNTEISEQDENLVMASCAGMPKFLDLIMSVDDTYICKGVNVGTGHVNYEGAVLVNGDVTEKMRLVATGDITINGFVESAYIEAGGDIVITEGAMGKESHNMDDCTCILKAAGNIHVQHGQGLAITCGKNLSVGKQLAYSFIRCGGAVTVGQIDNPKGNLFACDIVSEDKVAAGTLGAVSGSTLKVDFSEGFNNLVERIDIIDEMLRQIRYNNTCHKAKIENINGKSIPKELVRRVEEAKALFQSETALLKWIESKAIELRTAKEKYQQRVRIVANKRIYPGVSLKLNKRTWRCDREHDRSEVIYEEHQWKFEPLTS